jgi:serine/threonine-protein kinase
MNYEEEIKDNDDYSMFKFEEEYVYSSDREPGTVIGQDPEPGKKVSKNKVILLKISTNGEAVTIPGGFIGEDYNTVCDSLRGLGLYPKATPQVDDNKEPGEVIKIDPSAGSSVPKGTDVIVYYAISSGDENFFDMPQLVGKDLEEVKSILTSNGLQLGSVDIVDDTAEKNEVLEQSVPANTPVRKGEIIDIVISSGRSILEKSIDLPKGIGALSIEVSVDGKVVITEMVDTSSASTYTIRVGGEEKNTPIKVYLNGALYYEATGDFTKDDVSLSNEKTYDICFYVDVVGMPQEEALTILNNAGYTEISLKYLVSDETPGKVLYQSPGFSTAPHLGTDAVVVLTIAKAETTEESTNPPVEDSTGENIEG